MADRMTPNRQQNQRGENPYRIPGALDYRDKSYLQRNTRGQTQTSVKHSAGNSTVKHSHRKKKSSMTVLWGMLYGSTAVVFVLILVLTVQIAGNNTRGTQQGENNTVNHEPFVQETEQGYISINSESYTAYIGQQMKLGISANPEELKESVVWTSNNEEAVTVDSYGNVRIVGEGVAAITATSGDYADAIVVEAVTDEYSVTSMGFPVYSEWNGQNTDIQQTTEENFAAGMPPSGETDTEPEGQTETEYSDVTAASEEEYETGTEPPSESHEDTTAATEEESSSFVEPTTEAAPPIDTDEMFAVLGASGFTEYLSNVCIFRKDEEYLGEVIVDSDSVHIYIKARTTEFDQAIRGALAYLLPNTYESVWSSYLSATKDKTINSDGRKVRFVMAATDAHAQIIVYNP